MVGHRERSEAISSLRRLPRPCGPRNDSSVPSLRSSFGWDHSNDGDKSLLDLVIDDPPSADNKIAQSFEAAPLAGGIHGRELGNELNPFDEALSVGGSQRGQRHDGLVGPSDVLTAVVIFGHAVEPACGPRCGRLGCLPGPAPETP